MTALNDPKEPFRFDRSIGPLITREIADSVVRCVARRFGLESDSLASAASDAPPTWFERAWAATYATIVGGLFGWAVAGRELWELFRVFVGE